MKISLLALLLIVTQAFGLSAADSSGVEFLAKAVSPPEIEFLDENQKKHLFEEFEDQVLLVHFWATWCDVCAKELPSLDRLQKDLRKQTFKIIAISEDFKGETTVKEFYKSQNIKNLAIYLDEKNKIFNALNIVGLPTSFIINKEGKIVVRITGVVDWQDEAVREVIQKYL
jgi:thiol-disulfide isomerase/thioredoxin